MITRVISDGQFTRAAILWTGITVVTIGGALIIWWLA